MRSLIDILADLLLKWKYSSSVGEEEGEHQREILDLPTPEAKRRVDVLLADAAKYRVVRESPSAEDSGRIASLGPSLQEFFGRYRKVEIVYSDARIDRDAIGPSSVDSAFIKIGDDVEFTEIVTKPGDDRIDEFSPGETRGGSDDWSFPTIYHWILALNRTIYEDGAEGRRTA